MPTYLLLREQEIEKKYRLSTVEIDEDCNKPKEKENRDRVLTD